MTMQVAHLVMVMALRCLSQDDAGWGRAMRAEFDEAARDGGQLRFALGCLMAAWRRLPRHREGRCVLASHALVLGLIVPIATFHLGCAWSGVRLLLSGHDHYHTMLAAGGARGRTLAEAYLAAAPALTALLFALGGAHLFIAWAILDGDGRRARRIWLVAAGIAAAIVGIVATAIPGAGGSGVQFAALAVELAAVPLLAKRRTPTPGHVI